jgi:hypothetical protein
MREHWRTTRRLSKAASLWLVCLFGFGSTMWAQTTYHLHAAPSSTPGAFQLQTSGPGATSASLMSGPMTVAGDYTVTGFDTQPGIPSRYGYIPAGSSVNFSLWMQSVNANGSLFPEAKLYLNSPSGTLLCGANSPSQLTASLQQFTFSCATATTIVMDTPDRLYLWIGVSQPGKGMPSQRARLSVEGNYDSQVTVPAPIPSIKSLFPPNGTVGTPVVIKGDNFGPPSQTSTVSFNGTVGTWTKWTNQEIDVPVPLGAVSGDVTVNVSGVVSNAVSFADASPSIITLNPDSGLVGAQVTIHGANFGTLQGPNTVTFAGVQAIVNPNGWTNTDITVTVPSSLPAGNANVLVAVNSVGTNTPPFGVRPNPTGLVPGSGPVGTPVTISGDHFGNSSAGNSVTFNGVSAPVTNWSDGSITVQVPNGATTGDVVVTVNNVPGAPLHFVVTPQILNLAPPSGPIGANITINGTTFGNGGTVTFNGVNAPTTTWQPSSIVVQVPNGATSGNVVVTTVDGASNPVPFKVAPAITQMSLQQGPPRVGFIIYGTGFGAAPGRVSIGNAQLHLINWDGAQQAITVQILAGTLPSDPDFVNVVVTNADGTTSTGVPFDITQPFITCGVP